MGLFYRFVLLLLIAGISCKMKPKDAASSQDRSFDAFKERFVDSAMRGSASFAIATGYGKYYDSLKIYDSAAYAEEVAESRRYLDTLQSFSYTHLSAQNRISFRIIENELRKDIWYTDTLRYQEWDPSVYNIGWDAYELLTRNFAPLEERLQLLSNYLKNGSAFYKAAAQVIKQPTREHTKLGMEQNLGCLDIFKTIRDSVRISRLGQVEKDSLQARVSATEKGILDFAAFLKKMLDDKNFVFRDYRIGKELFNRKFGYDLVTGFTSEEIFELAVAAKKNCLEEMYRITTALWPKYFGTSIPPADRLQRIQKMIDTISYQHATPAGLFDTLRQQVAQLKSFIVEKDLFDFDTSFPVQVRKMPPFAMGFAIASASFPPIFEKGAVTYFNMADLTEAPAAEAESQLREYNDYYLQILTIHEAIPGHCLQGIYNYKKSPDIIKAVYGNGTMNEGWANYCQRMMLEQGWGGHTPEMWLIFYKASLRECCNTIVDYGIHCLNYSKEDVFNLLTREAFQEKAQVEEKYNRATLSQVQLCSYFTGSTEIFSLLEEYKTKKASKFSLKDFHEQFLSYGSSPVRFIREAMIE